MMRVLCEVYNHSLSGLNASSLTSPSLKEKLPPETR